jgi:hypothetical protein
VIVYVGGREHRFDVKTRGKPSHDTLLVPTWQYEKTKLREYIGARLNEPKGFVEVFGLAYWRELEELHATWLDAPNYGRALGQLRPIEKVLATLDEGPAVEHYQPELDFEPVTKSDGSVVNIPVCPECGGRPESAAALFKKPNLRCFCGCPL